jgi:hypothetical protein
MVPLFLKEYLIKVSRRFTSWALNQAHNQVMNKALLEEVFLVQNSHGQTFPQINTAAYYHNMVILI